MARTKIDYGIDLGTTNSAISRMERGEVKIIKSLDKQKDTTPSCVAFNKKGNILVGDAAFNTYRSDSLKALAKNAPINAFVEFKRTMGTNKKYHSANLDKDLTSEELSAEVLKRLKEYVNDEKVDAVVITVPAAFNNNQIDATRRAAKLAGFEHAEMLQEPVAAAMAYGIDSTDKNGFWLVFDYGGGTFDSALLKVEEGIMKVVDTEGDNYLGGQNLDYAIVDDIIIPHIQENFDIDNLLSDDIKKAEYRSALKFFAEEMKNNLSFNDTYNLYVDPGDCGEDDNGEEIEIDLTVTQNQLKTVLAPVFQRAIDCATTLLKRNNLSGSSLDSLILVGGPTLSPIVREMLEQQVCTPNTSVDPMTVVSKGAALYASTVELSDEIKEQTRDTAKIQLEIGHEASTVEVNEMITLKILEDKTSGVIPPKVFAQIKRMDNAWSSEKIEINTIGEIVDVHLNEGKTNTFEVTLYDDKGNFLECEPNEFTIIQGAKIGAVTLSLNWGIELKLKSTGKIVFKEVQGLEKNKSLPATGTRNGLKTQKQIRPGMDSDFIKIPLYQGESGADGTRAIYNIHVYDIIITGNDLPALLPENSDVDLTISIDKSQEVSVEAYFPYLDYTMEVKVPTGNVQSVDTNWLANEIRKTKGSIRELKEKNTNPVMMQKLENEVGEIDKQFNTNKNDEGNKQQVLKNLRASLKEIDQLAEKSEWPNLEKKLKDEFYRLEKANGELGDDKSTELVNSLRSQLDEVIAAQDVKLGNALYEEIQQLYIMLTLVYQLIGFITNFDRNFNSYAWQDPHRARQLIRQGMQAINENPDVKILQPIFSELVRLLPKNERPSGDDSVLVG